MLEKQYGTTRFEQLEELKRELRMRQSVYPKWVKAGRLQEKDRLHRVNCLLAVIEDFEARHKPSADQGSLGL